jgi:four helix bundle protein
MASVRRFQDLESHKLAVLVRREVIRLTDREPVRRDFKFVDQIRDSARGGPRNIAEGFSRFNPTEILQFLSYAQASLDETKNHTMDAQETGYFSDDESEAVLKLIARTLGAIREWREYLESPAARRFYEQHKARRRSGKPREPQESPDAPQHREPGEPV